MRAAACYNDRAGPRGLPEPAATVDAGGVAHRCGAWRGADEARVARQILDWADSTLGHVWWGRRSRSGSFVPTLQHKGTKHQLFAVWTYGTVEIYFYWYQSKPPFDSEEK